MVIIVIESKKGWGRYNIIHDQPYITDKQDHDSTIISKKYKEFETALFEILKTKIFSRMLLILNKAYIP